MRNDVLVSFLHEFLRVDIPRQRVEIIRLAVAAVKSEHLVQEIRTVRVACIIKERCLTVVQRLCETAAERLFLIREGERLTQICLSGEDIAIPELRVAERDNLLDLCLHLARNRGPVAAVLILIIIRALNGLGLERLLDVLHRAECRLGCVHP